MQSAEADAGAAILVTGMHRSGTSLLARMLGATGLALPGPLLDAPRPDNAHGYAENAEVVALHEALLDRLGRTWHGPDGARPLPPDWLLWPETAAAAAAIRGWLRRAPPRGRPWALKDPRLSRFLPLWLPLCAEQGIPVRIVLALRHPLAVAASLARRNGLGTAAALDLWHAHTAAVLADGGPCSPVVLDYDRMLSEPQPVLRDLLAALGCPTDDTAVAAAAALADPSERNHAAPEDTAPGHPALLLYEALRAGHAPANQAAPEDGAEASVGIVMRTRDRLPLLPRALRSVLGQTHRTWRLHLVNDGGDPAAIEALLAPYRPALGERLVLLHRPLATAGMEAASNAALASVRESFVVVHDDDDSWRPDFLRRCLAELANPAVKGVVTATERVLERSDGGEPVVLESRVLDINPGDVTLAALQVSNRFPPIAFVYARDVLDAIGPYRESLPVLGDWEFNLRFASRYRIAWIAEPLARLHQRLAGSAFPNSPPAEHRRVEAALRRELARDGRIPALPPAPREPPLWHLSLAPVRWRGVVRRGEAWIAQDDDPQVEYLPPPPGIPPGRWRVSVTLDVPPDGGAVELFHAQGGRYAPEKGIRLHPEEGTGAFVGLLASAEPITHLRLDPRASPGPFRPGPLVLDALEPEGRAPGPGRLPGFLGIGAQRSGTTWLHRNLSGHPGIWLPPAKELHFFDALHGIEVEAVAGMRMRVLAAAREAVLRAAPGPALDAAWRDLAWAARFATRRLTDEAWYAALFAGAPEGALAGEITPAYALLPEAGVAQVARLMTGLRAILMMRDPVERSISGALHATTVAAGRDAAPTRAAIAAALEAPGCVARSEYRPTIERWERHLGPASLLPVFLDDVRADPLAVLRRICGGLGLPFDPGWFPEASRRANSGLDEPGRYVEPETLRRLARRHLAGLEWLAARFGGAAEAWVDRARALTRGALSPATRRARSPASVRAAMAEVVARHGPWRWHNLEVAEGVFTIGPEETGDEVRLQRFRAASDALLGPPGPGMRVLDLGCGEGLYAVDYARRGAEVLGLELREANLARARLAQWALDLPRLRLERQDVRGLLPAELGRFDLVICSGLLYHLDTPDLFDLVERIAAVTGRLALFDTRIALDSVESRVWRGEAYAGLVYREHEPESDAATRLARAGSSYPNEKSFWLTHHALVTLLERSGFRTVMQLHAPPYRQPRPDRITLVALP